MSINIRLIQPQDNANLALIIRNCFIEFDAPKQGTVFSDPTTDDLFQYFQKEKSICWVAEINNIIVGCCGIYPTENLPEGYVELVKFYLSNSARGKGIGKLLINKCIETAKDFNYTNIYLESLPHFKTAIKMYEKLDFIELQQPLGNSGHSSCDIWMTKSI